MIKNSKCHYDEKARAYIFCKNVEQRRAEGPAFWGSPLEDYLRAMLIFHVYYREVNYDI